MGFAPTAFRTKLIITTEQNTRANPIIALNNTFLPVPNKFALPAEIIIIIPPTETAIIARGVAICQTIKLYIPASIWKKLFILQLGPSQGTNPAALVKDGKKIINDNKNIFFISFCALARIRTRNDWFEASYDIQFHHEGIFIECF